MRLEGGFINNLSKVYGIYTLGFSRFRDFNGSSRTSWCQC